MFSLKRLSEKLNEGEKKKKLSKQSKEKEQPLCFLSLEKDKSSISSKDSCSNTNLKAKDELKSKTKYKLGLSWRFYNKVVTEEAPESVITDIHLKSGSEIINKIGKHKHKCLALDKVVEIGQNAKKRKKNRDRHRFRRNPKVHVKKIITEKDIHRNAVSTLAGHKRETLSQHETHKPKLLKSSKKRQRTPTSESELSVDKSGPKEIHTMSQTTLPEFHEKRQKIRKSPTDSEAQKSNSDEMKNVKKSVSFPHKVEEENITGEEDTLSLEMAKFYRSLSEDDNPFDSKEINDAHKTSFIPPHDVHSIEEIQSAPLSPPQDVQSVPLSPPPVFQSVALSLSQDVQSSHFSSEGCEPYEKSVPYDPAEEYYTEETKSCLGSKLTGEGSLLVALFPNSKIYISGYYYLKLILGSVRVLGYIFKEEEEHPVFSPRSHSALSINVLSGVPIKSFEKEKVEELGIPFEWTQEFQIPKDQLVAIVRLSKYESNMTKLLSGVSLLQDCNNDKSFDIDVWKEALGIHLIEASEYSSWKLLRESEEWDPYLKHLQRRIVKKKDCCIMLTGGKNVGKSTLFKFFINTLISNPDIPEVACLDLDPGQSEMTTPGCLSLTRVNVPLLGPAFSHAEKKFFTYQRRILLADVSVNFILREYMEVLSALLTEYRNFKSSVPLLVNTMGYTANVGFDIMADILRVIKPTHVVTIETYSRTENFPYQLHPEVITSIKRGIATFPGRKLYYDYTVFRAVSKPGKGNAAVLRDINLLGHLSRLWKDDVYKITGETCKPPVKIDWRTVAIYVQGTVVPQTHILQAINASLVALCHINTDCLEEVEENLPLRTHNDCSWFKSNKFIAWGVVQGIDPIKRLIHILTPLSEKEVLAEVNVLALTKLKLPKDFQKLFSLRGAPYQQVR